MEKPDTCSWPFDVSVTVQSPNGHDLLRRRRMKLLIGTPPIITGHTARDSGTVAPGVVHSGGYLSLSSRSHHTCERAPLHLTSAVMSAVVSAARSRFRGPRGTHTVKCERTATWPHMRNSILNCNETSMCGPANTVTSLTST